MFLFVPETERLNEDDSNEIGTFYAKTCGQTVGMICRLLSAAGENTGPADDLAGEVYLKVIRYKERFLGQTEQVQYGCLVMMIRNVCFDYLRKTGKIRFFPLPDEEDTITDPAEADEIRRKLREEASGYETPPEALIRKERAALVRRAVERLGSPAREIVTERYYLNYSYAEIAREHRMKQTAVGVVLHRSLEKIRKELENYVGNE